MASPLEPPTTLSESSSSAMEVFNSVKVSIADLCAKGTAQFAHKNYEAAADLYSRASALQAELNGDMSPDNAEVLFLYGRSLFELGMRKSDVFGGRAAGKERKKTEKSNGAGVPKQKKELPPVTEEKSEGEKIAEEAEAIVAEHKNGEDKEGDTTAGAKKPLFQFFGDENFEDSDDEEQGGGAEDAEEEEEEAEEEVDDLATSFQILDLAKVLFLKRLEEPEQGDEKGKLIGDSPMVKHIKERLADTHNYLAQICLEDEKFPEAITELRAALTYKTELYPEDSGTIVEAHWMLFLSLELASNTTKSDTDSEEKADTDTESDLAKSLHDEAIKEIDLAIKSAKLQLQNKEVELAETASPDENDVTRLEITDMKDMLSQMEERKAELTAPPVDLKKALYDAAANAGGVLSAVFGESPEEAAARIEDAKKNAHDVTSIVRKKEKVKPTATEAVPSHNGTNGKRKAEDDVDDSDSKKARVEDEPAAKAAEIEVAVEEVNGHKVEGVEVKDFAVV